MRLNGLNQSEELKWDWLERNWDLRRELYLTHPVVEIQVELLENSFFTPWTSLDFIFQARIPTLTWYNHANGSFIMRCSQPRTGALGRVRLFYHIIKLSEISSVIEVQPLSMSPFNWCIFDCVLSRICFMTKQLLGEIPDESIKAIPVCTATSP